MRLKTRCKNNNRTNRDCMEHDCRKTRDLPVASMDRWVVHFQCSCIIQFNIKYENRQLFKPEPGKRFPTEENGKRVSENFPAQNYSIFERKTNISRNTIEITFQNCKRAEIGNRTERAD